MLRSPVLVIGQVLTIDIIALVKKMVGEIQNTGCYSRRSLPFSLACSRLQDSGEKSFSQKV